MKNLLLALFAVSSPLFALEQQKDLVMPYEVKWDGPMEMLPFPWVQDKSVREPRYGASHANANIYCGPLDYLDQKTLVPWLDCYYSIVSFNFRTREIIAIVDFATANRSKTALRYVAAISGQPESYVEFLNEPAKVGGTKETSIANVLDRLTQFGVKFKQERFVDGKLNIRHLGKWKFDPFDALGFKENKGAFRFEARDYPVIYPKGATEFDLKGGQTKYPNRPTEVYDALATTTQLLKEGLEELKLQSDDDAKEVFVNRIKANAKIISLELTHALAVMRTRPYQNMELVHVVNGLCDLIASLDDLIQDKLGAEPGFIETLKQASEESTPANAKASEAKESSRDNVLAYAKARKGYKTVSNAGAKFGQWQQDGVNYSVREDGPTRGDVQVWMPSTRSYASID